RESKHWKARKRNRHVLAVNEAAIQSRLALDCAAARDRVGDYLDELARRRGSTRDPRGSHPRRPRARSKRWRRRSIFHPRSPAAVTMAAMSGVDDDEPLRRAWGGEP